MKPKQFGLFRGLPNTATPTARREGGKLAKARGQWFEKELEGVNNAYRIIEEAFIARVHPPVAGPPGHMRIVGAGPVDFMGVWKGRAIAFDAKTRDDPASFKYDVRDRHQIEALHDFNRSGGIAFVLIADSSRSMAYVLHGKALEQLHDGKTVPLRSQVRAGPVKFLHPYVLARSPFVVGRPATWDYLRTIAHILTGTSPYKVEP